MEASTRMQAGEVATPEDMFLAWFLRLPHHADVTQAARQELARLDRLDIASDSLHRFRIMLELASASPAHVAQPGRRRAIH